MRGLCLLLLLCVTARCASSGELKARSGFAEQIAGARGITVIFYQLKHGDEAEKASQQSLARVVDEEFRAVSTVPIRFAELPWLGTEIHRLWGPLTDRERATHREGWVVVRVHAITYPRSSTALRGLTVLGDIMSGLGGGSGFSRKERMDVSLPTNQPLSFAQRAWPWLSVPHLERSYWKGTLSDPAKGRKEVRKLLARLWKKVRSSGSGYGPSSASARLT
jgi:hypothetical protein